MKDEDGRDAMKGTMEGPERLRTSAHRDDPGVSAGEWPNGAGSSVVRPPSSFSFLSLFILIICVAALFYSDHWFLACLLGGLYLYGVLRRPRTLPGGSGLDAGSEHGDPAQPTAFSIDSTKIDVYNLAVLTQELKSLLETDSIELALHDQAIEGIDLLLTKILAPGNETGESGSRREALDAAWELLIRENLVPHGPPPWRLGEQASERLSGLAGEVHAAVPDAARASGDSAAANEADLINESAAETTTYGGLVSVPPISPESAAMLSRLPDSSISTSTSSSGVSSTEGAPTRSTSPILDEQPGKGPSLAGPPDGLHDSSSYTWKVSEPSALERALRSVSGWHALVVPFLVQNIGWFVGGLCFVAGSIFLVSYTAGFAKALTVSAILSAYTVLILWAGYKLTRSRPELETSSHVLFSVGVLLMPLDIAASTRLIAGAESVPQLVIGILTAAMITTGLYYCTMLISGIMDRSLQGRHPQIFLAIAASQLTVPLLMRYPYWPLLAVLHLVLLGLLACGLLLFTHEWLQSIFVERKKTAYYAAGTLVYAAVVSFVHLTWGYDNPSVLPAGYYGPFVMALCSLLFYVDAQLKRLSTQAAFISRLSFFIYGLSILALTMSARTPTSCYISLLLGALMYGMVFWQYLTLPPLYLLLGCLSWLYGLLVLRHVSDQWYLLASLPGLAGLFAANVWLVRRKSTGVSLVFFWTWSAMCAALALWSLSHARPGVPGMVTAVTVMVFLYYGAILRAVDTDQQVDLWDGPWLYALTLMGCVAVGFAPVWAGLDWMTQCAFGLVLLAQLWAILGWRLRLVAPQGKAIRSEVLYNSAIFNLALSFSIAVLLSWSGITEDRALPLLLAAMGGVFLWLTLNLRERWPFYCVLGLWGAAGLIFKLIFFPEPGTGAALMLLALGVWSLLWWLEHEPEEAKTLRREQMRLKAGSQPPLSLLWKPASGSRTCEDLLCAPLQQTVVGLWLIGLALLSSRYILGDITWNGIICASLGALVGILALGRFRLLLALPTASMLGLVAWLSAISHLFRVGSSALNLAAAIYVLLCWLLATWALRHRGALRIAEIFHLSGDLESAEQGNYLCTLAVDLLCASVSLLYFWYFSPSFPGLAALLIAVMFLWLSGQRYQQISHSYLVLLISVVAGLFTYLWSSPFYSVYHSSVFLGLGKDTGIGLVLVSSSLGMWMLAFGLDRLAGGAKDTSDFNKSLYRKPLRNSCAALSLCAACRQIALAWNDSVAGIDLFRASILAMAALSLLLANGQLRRFMFDLAGTLVLVLAGLWAQATLFHSGAAFTLLPEFCLFSDRWLTMSLMGLGLALLAEKMNGWPGLQSAYALPLRVSSLIISCWAMAGALARFISAPIHADLFLASSFLALMITVFPLSTPIGNAAAIRGIIVSVLSCPFIVSSLFSAGLGQWLNFAALAWGFVLWGSGNFILPLWNQSRRKWELSPDAWPWVGLVSIVFGLAASTLNWIGRSSAITHAGYELCCAVYVLMMLRNCGWSGFPWIAAFLMNGACLTFNTLWLNQTTSLFFPELGLLTLAAPFHSYVGTVLSINILLLIVPMWRRYGEALFVRWRWHRSELATPFLVWPSLIFAGLLLQFVALQVDVLKILPLPRSLSGHPYPVFTGSLLTLSFMHVWALDRARLSSHAVLASLFFTLMAGWLDTAMPSFHLPLFLALWSALALAAHCLWEARKWGSEAAESLRDALAMWLAPSMISAMAALVLVGQVSLTERLLTVAVLIVLTATLGLRRLRKGWLVAAMVMLLALLHGWPLIWVPLSKAPLLAPWYALQSIVLACVLLWAGNGLDRYAQTKKEGAGSPAGHSELITEVAEMLSKTWFVVYVISIVECTIHGYLFAVNLAGTGNSHWLATRGDTAAVLLAAALIMLVGIRQSLKTQKDIWIYGLAAFCCATGVYIRLIVVGLAPVNVWDTAAIMAFTYVLLAIGRFTLSRPLLHVVLVLPVLALLTVPFQLASTHGCMTLVSAGVLYLLTYREANHPFPLYLALLALNAAVYLWVPAWADRSRMIQIYSTPAAISVLLLLHLHRKELRPSVLNSVRLATTGVLYASATLDVFLRGELLIFALALILSLCGVVAGIALRIRAFLYSGLTFLVINILGQIILLFPEQRLGKAIMLLILGVVITGGMIWFNMKREEILQRIRIFRTDLETWS